jgi:hypothetical protein
LHRGKTRATTRHIFVVKLSLAPFTLHYIEFPAAYLRRGHVHPDRGGGKLIFVQKLFSPNTGFAALAVLVRAWLK